jgi:hypothetical protein
MSIGPQQNMHAVRQKCFLIGSIDVLSRSKCPRIISRGKEGVKLQRTVDSIKGEGEAMTYPSTINVRYVEICKI